MTSWDTLRQEQQYELCIMTKRTEKATAFDFARILIAWQKQHGRHGLPWQKTRSAYRIWLSEIMLQQTQVATVVPYYTRFLRRFPNVCALAEAEHEEVMALWSGLGYYARARHLHRCAKVIVQKYGGRFPMDAHALAQLPGIGRSTASAIVVFSCNIRAPILDGNVVRFFSRLFGIDGYAGTRVTKERLWQQAELLLPGRNVKAYTQGLMDVGATLCTRVRPACERCPFADRCVALAEDSVSALPTRKPSRALPQKQVVMALLVYRGSILLKKRPDSGIWGGLFSLPEEEVRAGREGAAEMRQWATCFGGIAEEERWNNFVHTFTHFRLHVTPILFRMSSAISLANDAEYVWYALDRTATAPLPAPVKKLLLRAHANAVSPNSGA
ncbi:MAG: A/G-specific adenine glycosylase [Burkholderiaceae bacterium]|jgi:A/G-specific adenine glycosylase|nr:A/G-specific adenine glycosylase [Burkholderiaceae bacterium]